MPDFIPIRGDPSDKLPGVEAVGAAALLRRHGWLVLPASVLRFNSEYFSLKVLPVNIPARTRPIAAVTLKKRLLSPVTKLFVDCTREVATAIKEG